jgi:hypothetical protein
MDHSPARRLRRIVTVTVAAVGLAASTVPAAQAAQAQDREGTTRVAVAPAVVAKLERLNLTAAPTGNSTAAPFNGTVAFRFPITDVKRDGNIIKHAGGARISSGHEAIALKRFKIKLGAGKVGAAVVVNGERVGRAEVFNLAESGRPGLGDVRLTLTRAAAGAVNSTFGAPAFDAGDNFGFATVNLD